MADALHLTFVKACDFGLVAEMNWISFSVARDLIKAGFAVEYVKHEPAPKQDGLVKFRMIATGCVYEMQQEIALDCIRRGDVELV